MSSVLVELDDYGGAITADLLARGWTRSDLGRRISWPEFIEFLQWLPPVPETALFRAKKPKSWWVTPTHQLLAGVLYAVEGANWQRSGGKGQAPKPVDFPEDRKQSNLDAAGLAAKREAMKRRRYGGN